MKHKTFFFALLFVSASLCAQQKTDLKGDSLKQTIGKPFSEAIAETGQNLSLIGVMDEIMLDDDAEGSSQEISSTVILSNDNYLNTAAFRLSPLRFKVRGYTNPYSHTYINGVNFNDQNRGVFNYASIGALNDVTRNGDAVNYHGISTFAYGAIGGSENINMRASGYARGTKLTMSYTNRNYYLRGMATYSTGLQDDGWAFTASVGGRFSDEGNVDGTFYNNFSYALSLEKQWNNNRHSLSFVTFGSPVERGQQSASVQEAYDLTGNNLYNPNWGWQDGKKRNSRVVRAYDPTAIVSHIWNISDKTNLTTGFATHYARYGNTALNWYNGPDPRADYYRYMPSYYSVNEDAYSYYKELWELKNSPVRQVDWTKMYRINELSRREGTGAAIYMVEERRSDLFEMTLNSTLNTIVSGKHKITAGIEARKSTSRQFKTVDDLLGAEYALDIDKFAERDFPGDASIIQNNLHRPDRKVYEGDTFGYDFHIDINSANVWVQNQYNISRLLDFHYAAKLKYTDFQREGKMQNGRFPDNSYGNGERHRFIDFGAKAGLVYKITGRHILTGNVSYSSEAPLPNVAYISPRVSDSSIKNLKSGRIFSADLNYVFSMPSFSGRISAFQTNFYDQMHRISYYDDSEKTFVNHVLYGMTKIHRGFELGLGYKLNNNWSFDLTGTVAEYFYGNNPDGAISYENGKADWEEKAYLKNHYVGGTPQVAGTFAINYFYDYWFVNLYLNGFGRNYIELAPLRRLASNYVNVDPNNPKDMEAYNYLIDQERFGSGYTLDMSIGKIIYLKNKNIINFNFSFQNITNRRNIRTGGYEQSRITVNEPERFNSKYYYMQGFNCYLNMSYRF